MKVKHLVGIDMSISSPGIGIYNLETKKRMIYTFSSKTTKEMTIETEDIKLIVLRQPNWKKENIDGFEKYCLIAENVHQFIKNTINDDHALVYFEGYSFASKGLTFNIGEITGLMKYLVRNSNWSFDIIPPSDWKKIIIGKGNVNKEMIYEKMQNHHSFGKILQKIEIPYKKGNFIEDICDAFCILEWIVLKSS